MPNKVPRFDTCPLNGPVYSVIGAHQTSVLRRWRWKRESRNKGLQHQTDWYDMIYIDGMAGWHFQGYTKKSDFTSKIQGYHVDIMAL